MYIDKNSNEGFWNSPWKVFHECSAIAYYATKARAKKLFNVMKDMYSSFRGTQQPICTTVYFVLQQHDGTLFRLII